MDIPFSQVLGQTAGTVRLASQERMQRIVERVVDVPVPQQVLEETVGVVGWSRDTSSMRQFSLFAKRLWSVGCLTQEMESKVCVSAWRWQRD